MSEQGEQQPGEGEAGRIQAYDERFGRIEHEQAEQRGLLEQIRDAVGGVRQAEEGAHAKAQEHTESRLDRSSTMADQVKRAVEAVNAEAEQKRRDEAHAADHARLREQAERPPREPQGGRRGKLQRALFGSDPS